MSKKYLRWFWSVRNPGNLTKYILSISIKHLPPPTPTFENETVCHDETFNLFPSNTESLSSKSSPMSDEPMEFSFKSFEEVPIEMEEIIPPPRILAGRKRSVEENIDPSMAQVGRPKRGRRVKKTRGAPLVEIPEATKTLESPETEPTDILMTDDEDTEDINQRRSLRIWGNKIAKELVEEALPDEIDGWKIPTDEEELEDGDDVKGMI